MSTTNNKHDCIHKVTVPLTVTPSALSGYTNFTEFTFTPLITGDFAAEYYTKLSFFKVKWDFGDGYVTTTDTPLQTTHTYNYPGVYTANIIFYDEDGDSYLNTLTKTISVNNFRSTEIDLSKNGNKRILYAGGLNQTNNEIVADIFTSWQDYDPTGNTVYFTASGSNSKPYDTTYKYAFLLPYRSFYTAPGGRFTKTNELKVKLEPHYFIPDSSGNPTLTSAAASGAKLLYASIEDVKIYYYDDLPGVVKIIAALDTSKHSLPDFYVNGITTDINLSDKTFMEGNIGVTDVEVVSATPTQLLLTTTGLKDMKLENQPFKREGNKFQVFVSPADADGNILKYYDKLRFSNSLFDLGADNTFKALVDTTSAMTDGTSTYLSSISTNKYPYNESFETTHMSSFGYLNYTPLSAGTYWLGVSARVDSQVLSGISKFNVSPGYNDYNSYINKHSEDFDYADTLKSYRFQEFLHQYDNFFDGVVSSIVGTLSSDPSTYGKRIFEKISNFVSNNTDIDVCNINAFKKFYSLLNEEADFIDISAPPELKRLFDLFSIRFKRVIGEDEKFDQSFDTFFSSNSALGRNIDLNNPLSVETYTVTAGTNFVVRQKFGDEYILIEPMNVPTSTINTGTTSQYPLSCFGTTSNWGWPLDDSYTGTSLSQIYEFYPFVTYFNNKRTNSVIDFENEYSSITSTITSLDGWKRISGVKYDSIDKQIRKGLNL